MPDSPLYTVHLSDGTTFGPAEVATLREWVAAGIVTRTTALSIHGDERRTPAAVVPGLFEPEHQVQATTQPAEPMYQAHLASGATDALALADLLRMAEAGEIVSTTPISLVGGSKRVPAAAVPGLETATRTQKGDEPSSCSSAPEMAQPTEEPANIEKPESDSSEDEVGHVQADSSILSPNPVIELIGFNVASFLGALVLGIVVIAILTKVGWPQGKVDVPGHNEVSRVLGLAQVLMVAQLFLVPGAQGLIGLPPKIEAWLIFPAVWCAVTYVVLKVRCRFDSEVDGVWPWLFGVILGIWYAAMLSAVWFGPHPIVLRP